MPELDLGLVKGEKGDPFKYSDFTAEQLAGLKGAPGVTPTIKAGTAKSLAASAAPTVTATTSGTTTTFNFGIPKGDTSALETPTFDDTTSTYSTLSAANTAAETSSNAIKSKTSIFTTLSNMKKSFSAIVQGLKILGTNVGAITGITSDLAGESETVAASIKCVNQLNSSLTWKLNNYGYSTKRVDFFNKNWNEMIIVVGNASNKFTFHVSKSMLSNPQDVAKGLTQGYGNNSTSNYCVINVFEDYIELVSFVIDGSTTPCDIYTYYR